MSLRVGTRHSLNLSVLIDHNKDARRFFQNLIWWIIRNLVVLHQLVASTCGVRVVPCTGRNLVGSTFGILWCSFLWASWCGIASMARGTYLWSLMLIHPWLDEKNTANISKLCVSHQFFVIYITFCSSLIDHAENGPSARLVAEGKSLRCWVL